VNDQQPRTKEATNMSDTNERSVASAGSHGDAVRSAALALYEAGRWVSVDVPREKADAMWATLRDALGLRPGHATTRGVDGGGTKPALTDEEREAIGMAYSRLTAIPHYEAVSATLRRLLERLT
jgi:hypothetical protein